MKQFLGESVINEGVRERTIRGCPMFVRVECDNGGQKHFCWVGKGSRTARGSAHGK